MSRIGNKKIMIPQDVEINISDSFVTIKSSKGEKKIQLPTVVTADVSGNSLTVSRKNELKESKSLHGTYLRLIENAIIGLSAGFVKKLEYKGVGYTVTSEDNKIAMRLGFSHQCEVEIPEEISVSIHKNVIVIEGTDKEKVGLFAAKIREIKKPEVYKGKGIRYQGESVKKKAGKAAQTASS